VTTKTVSLISRAWTGFSAFFVLKLNAAPMIQTAATEV
jgi:hypothetical protein